MGATGQPCVFNGFDNAIKIGADQFKRSNHDGATAANHAVGLRLLSIVLLKFAV